MKYIKILFLIISLIILALLVILLFQKKSSNSLIHNEETNISLNEPTSKKDDNYEMTIDNMNTEEPTEKETSEDETPTDIRENIRDTYYSSLVKTALNDGRKVVYLTFDDGSSEYTETVINLLNKYNAKGTFFVVGAYSTEDLARKMYNKILDNDNTLGIHSYTHSRADIYSSVNSFTSDFDLMNKYVYNLTTYKPWLWRFPGGSSTSMAGDDIKNAYIPYIHSKGFTYFDWNVSSGDGSSSTTSDQIYHNVFKYAIGVLAAGCASALLTYFICASLQSAGGFYLSRRLDSH